jgi:hypothetical protein
MSKATAVQTESTPTYHQPSLRVLASARAMDESRSHALTPLAIVLGLVLWAAGISLVWLFF